MGRKWGFSSQITFGYTELASYHDFTCSGILSLTDALKLALRMLPPDILVMYKAETPAFRHVQKVLRLFCDEKMHF